MSIEFTSEQDLGSFLRHLDSNDLTIVVGSGLSNGSVPNVAQFAKIFLREFSGAERLHFQTYFDGAKDDPTLAYQNMAAALDARRGLKGVAAPLRREILRCYRGSCEQQDPSSLMRAETDTDNWDIPEAHIELAKFVTRRPSDVKTTIITTNFDPFIELAINHVLKGNKSRPVILGTNKPISSAELHSSPEIPVIHIHGYWRLGETLHTQSRLTADRPYLDKLITAVMTGTSVVVIGYGGWPDAFMKNLSLQVPTLAEEGTEIAWAFHGHAPDDSHEILRALLACSAVRPYYGIDAERLFQSINSSRHLEFSTIANGYSILSAGDAGALDQAVLGCWNFAHGAEPTWDDALPASWPLLSNAKSLLTEARKVAEGVQLGVVALAPTGEGKSMALRQVAVRISSEYPGVCLLWRSHLAAPLTTEFLQRIAESLDQRIIIASDDADLIAHELRALVGSELGMSNKVGFLLTAQDRLWERSAGPYLNLNVCEFRKITEDDSREIVSAWRNFEELNQWTADPSQLYQATRTVDFKNPGSLIGGILTVASPEGLRTRITELLDKLDHPSQPGKHTPLYKAFAAVCLIQSFLDPAAEEGLGTTTRLISGASEMDLDRVENYILRSLGREAAITVLGGAVYARHSSIAQIVAAEVINRGQAEKILEPYVACATQLAYAQPLELTDGERAISLLYRKVPKALKVSMARVLVRNSPERTMRARVSYMWACRHDSPSAGYTFAGNMLKHRGYYKDCAEQCRGALVETAWLAREVDEKYAAMGFASLSICDQVSPIMHRDHLQYALFCLQRCAEDLALVQAAYGEVAVIAELLRTRAGLLKRESRVKVSLGDEARANLSRQSTERLTNILRQHVSQCALDASRPIEWPMDRVTFEELLWQIDKTPSAFQQDLD